MKKHQLTRLAALLLAVVLCLAVGLPAAAVEEELPAPAAEEEALALPAEEAEVPAEDGAAAHSHDGVTFTNNMLLLTSFYLTADVVLPMDITVPAGKTVNICLNGHKLSAGGHTLVVKGVVNLYDCQGGGLLDTTDGILTIDGGVLNKNGCTVYTADILDPPTAPPEATMPPEPAPFTPGGWVKAEDFTITPELKELFEKAVEDDSGASYEPVAYLAYQIVNGKNHCFAAEKIVPGPDAEATSVLVFIYEDTEGGVECTDIMDIGSSGEPTGEPEQPAVELNEDGRMAQASGSFEGMYARVALILDNNGQSGLYVTQAVINEDGKIVIPAFQVPGLQVKGVNVALVPTIDDIQSPTPEVKASAFRMLG